MVAITYIAPDGSARRIEVAAGLAVMEGARDNGVAGIEAECGGACSCSTCHVYIAPEWLDRLPPKGPIEEDMLEFAWEADHRSRLTCQITVSAALDGLVVLVPERQA